MVVVSIEVLKQPLHKPLPVEKQVVILYALTHGFLDSVPVDQILDFEEALYDYFDSHHEDIFETIRTTKDLPEESVLNEAIQAFKDQVRIQIEIGRTAYGRLSKRNPSKNCFN